MDQRKINTTGRLIHDPQLVLWKVSREIPNVIVKKMLKLPKWDTQVVYLASQLDIICRIATTLENDAQKVTLGTFLQIRTLMEAVSNAIAGSHVLKYAQEELEMLQVARMDRRGKSNEQHGILIMHRPPKWVYHQETTPLWNRCNSIANGNADAGFYMRADGLNALDIKGLAFTMLSLIEGSRDYLKSIDCFYAQEEWDRLSLRVKEALEKVPVGGEVSSLGKFHPFEARLYAELVKRGVNQELSDDVRRAETAAEWAPSSP
jgi:hypothetical protein